MATVNGNAGNNVLEGTTSADTLNGNDGDDTLRGGLGTDRLNGGDDFDLADYFNSNAGISITLSISPSLTTRGSGGHASGDTLSSIEGVRGSQFVDTLGGNGLANLLIGQGGDDRLRGGDGNDTLIGGVPTDASNNGFPDDANLDGIPDGVDTETGGGNDYLDGGFGDDRVYGGGGDDTILGGFGNDFLRGGQGADYISASDGIDTVDGGGGDDDVYGSLGDDVVTGGDGNDYLNGSLGDDNLSGNDGNDEIDAGDANSELGADGVLVLGTNLLDGGAGNDQLTAGIGNDELRGGTGDDVLAGGDGADLQDGGDGVDTADYSRAAASLLIDLSSTTAQGGGAAGDLLVSIERILGSAVADQIFGNTANNTFVGGGGNDFLVGQQGLDTVDYSDRDAAVTVVLTSTPALPTAEGTATRLVGDVLETDRLVLIERVIGSSLADNFTGGELNDIFVGGSGGDSITGGLGVDTAEYSTSAAAVTIDLGAGTASGGDAAGDVLVGIENLIGSALNDELIGDAANNRLDGGAGNDVLRGGVGADTLIGGDGVDTADYSTSAVGVTIAALPNVPGTSITVGGLGDAQLDVISSSIENLIGSSSADILFGSLNASAGNPTPIANRISGGAGNDSIRGNDGNDVLTGGLGQDALVGDAGADTFIYTAAAESGPAAPDFIINFEKGSDRVDLSLLDGNAATPLTFVSGAAFAGGGVASVRSGQANVTGAPTVGFGTIPSGPRVVLDVDIDGDAIFEVTDLRIAFVNLTQLLVPADLIL